MGEAGSTPAVSAIVVSWNGRQDLELVLGCLAEQTVPVQVVVVDNGSQDGSAAFVRERHPAVHLIALDRNTGFAEPHLLALPHTTGEWILTVNNDVTFGTDFVACLLAAADSDRDPDHLFAVGATLVFDDRRAVVQTLGVEPLPNGNGVNVAKNEPLSDQRGPRDVFGPCAGAAIYRRTVLADIGFFDGRYFAYLEDLDLAHRARAKGYHAISTPTAVGFHKHSRTLRAFPFLKLYLIERNRLLNLVKHYPRRYLWAESLVTFVIVLRFRFTADKARVTEDQKVYFRLGNVPRLALVFVRARWYLLRHYREFSPR